MSSIAGLQCLRPYLFRDLPVARNLAYARFYKTTRRLATQARPSGDKRGGTEDDSSIKLSSVAKKQGVEGPVDVKGPSSVQQRIEELKNAKALVYPRIQRSSNTLNFQEYMKLYGNLEAGVKLEDIVTIRGRVLSVRISGKKLVFLDIVQDGRVLQAICSLGNITSSDLETFRAFTHLVRRGDIVSVLGSPVGKGSGPVSINAKELPQILSPALPLLPTTLEDPQTRIRNRHVDLLVNKSTADTIRARSHIIQHIREFLLRDGFLEVQTPIIVDKASGAAARPFTTFATEFLDKELALRIAPEIWLKRLILGGMDRIFEIGPAFRNEGLDATHNPEFTTCEFYKSFTSLDDLMLMTEDMISGIAARVNSLRSETLKTLPAVDPSLSAPPFKRLEFIPALESALGEALPDLAAENATESLVGLFMKHDITVPQPQTLPRLLDKLCSVYIEPQCQEPTYIIHHPACMAPLSKSFLDPATNQLVSARAELFIQQTEIANMYEEENSPFEQRRKLVDQALLRDEETGSEVDESYLKALEWGLPPTGGWGCGIDRMCMLFSGSSRISDVLSFGSLKNVVNLSTFRPEKGGAEEEDV